MASKLPDVYVDVRTKLIVIDHEHGGVPHLTPLDREGAIGLIGLLIRALEELSVIRYQL